VVVVVVEGVVLDGAGPVVVVVVDVEVVVVGAVVTVVVDVPPLAGWVVEVVVGMMTDGSVTVNDATADCPHGSRATA
jgi:hypothetical protein